MSSNAQAQLAGPDHGDGHHLSHGSEADHLPQEILARPVLVIEDEMMIAWTLESMLEDMGFQQVVIASSGEQAIEESATISPGLIVSDINLGPAGMDGIAAVAAIRPFGIAVLFVSGYAGEESVTRIGRDVPGARIVRKPISSVELRRTIVQAFNQAAPPSAHN